MDNYKCFAHGPYSHSTLYGNQCPACDGYSTPFSGSGGDARKDVAELNKKLAAENLAANTWKTDPWAHRSAGMKCKTCMWFVEKGDSPTPKIGRCRRHAPSMNGYPVVFQDDWCGDHKVDESKL